MFWKFLLKSLKFLIVHAQAHVTFIALSLSMFISLTQFSSVQFAVVLHHGGVSVVQFVHRPLQLCDGPEEAPRHLAQRRQQEGVERARQEEHGGADQEEGGGRG